MSARKPPQEKVGNVAPFGLRLLPELKQKLEKAAAAERHSLNREITVRLERSFINYLNLSGEGLEQILKQASSVTDALWEMFFFQREVELDGFIADQAREGRVMTRPQAIAHILREYLSTRGYVFEPPDRRPGLQGAEFGQGPFDKFKAFMDLEPIYTDYQRVPEIVAAMEEAATAAISKRLEELEAEGVLQLRRSVVEGGSARAVFDVDPVLGTKKPRRK